MLFSKHTEAKMDSIKYLLTEDSPFIFSESYKKLRMNLNFLSVDHSLKKIMVCSSNPDEGKSLTICNLAITMAQAGSKVLMIDCDLRNPTLHRILRMRTATGYGLSDLLTQRAALDDCIGHHPTYNFSFIPAGTIPPNPAELLNSKRMSRLLETLENEYDYILMDTPPVNIVADAMVLSQRTDGAVMVVRQPVTPKNDVRNGLNALKSVNCRILGVVLNDCDAREVAPEGVRGSYGYRYSYRYGNNAERSKGNKE